jgi:hypothetical protein
MDYTGWEAVRKIRSHPTVSFWRALYRTSYIALRTAERESMFTVGKVTERFKRSGIVQAFVHIARVSLAHLLILSSLP